MSGKFKTFCRISDYIESADPEFAELLKGTCSILNLNTKGKPGLTLLVPQDKAYRKKIADLAYSASPKDAQTACDMLNALIIKDVFKTGADWMTKKANIPNSVFPNQHVEVDSASGKEVKFKSGAKAVIDEKFIDSSKRNNLSVWHLVSGEIPVTTDKPSKPVIRGKKGAYAGGADPVDENQQLLINLVTKLESEYLHLLKDPAPGRNIGNVSKYITGGSYGNFKPLTALERDPFLEVTLSLVQFAKKEYPDILYNWILPHISFNKIDVYLILQPYAKFRRFLPPVFVQDWLKYCTNTTIKFQEAIDCVNTCLNTHKDKSLLYSDRLKAMELIDETRRSTFEGGFTREKFRVAAMIYMDFMKEVDSLANLFPEELMNYYREHQELKMAEDELRYVTNIMFEKGLKEFNTLDRMNGAQDIFRWISEHSENNSTVLFNEAILASTIFSQGAMEQRIDFIKSTFYMFLPLTAREIKNFPIKNVHVKPKLNSRAVWMMHTNPESQYEGRGESHEDLVSLLNAVGVDCSDDVKQAIIAAYNRIKN
jgi:hypothetical protein